MQSESDIERRRRATQEAMIRGLQRPRATMEARTGEVGPSSFMPGESAGMPDSFWNRQFPFLRSTQGLREQQPGYATLGADNNARDRTQPAITPPATAGLSLPQPVTPNINVAGIEPPSPGPAPTPSPAPRIGYSTAGLSGLDRVRERRRALEEADPESQVTDTGEILAPQKTGRLKGLGTGLGVAAQSIDPDRPMFSLGQLLGGGLSGLTSPRGAMKDQRRIDLARLDNDYLRGIKLEQEQAQLEGMRGPKMGQMSTRVVTEGEYPGLEPGTEIRTRIDPRSGQIADVLGPNNRPVIADLAKRPTGAPHYEKDSDGYLLTVQGGRATRVTDESGKPVQVKRSGDEEYVEVEVNGRKMRVTPGQALNYYGQLGERETRRDEARAEREAKYSAAKSEYDSLVEAEKVAGEEKNRAYQVLDQMRKSNQPKEDVAQAEQTAQEADRYYRSFGEKKKDAARRMQENDVRTAPSASRATTHAFSIGAYLSRNKGATEADARAYAKQHYPDYEVVP